MKLEEVKATIDSYFDNISEEEFFDLITTKYSMPVVYEIDMPLASTARNDIIPTDINEIDYRHTYSGDIPTDQIVNINSSQPIYEMSGNDPSCVSFSLSFAA